MATAKAKLKAAREAIGSKDWLKAEKAAKEVLDLDPGNYNGHVFLGLAMASQGGTKAAAAEQIYHKATALSPKQLLAWQGLATLYEEQGKAEEEAQALTQIMNVCNEGGDAPKLGETLQKLLVLRRQHGSRTEIMDSLACVLPSSPYFATLATLPPPDPTNPSASPIHSLLVTLSNTLPTLNELLTLAETEESSSLSKELAVRRTRLSSASLSPSEQKAALVREVYPRSRLPSLWREVINHPSATDDDRASAEAAMLEHAKTLLEALPSPFPSEVADFSTAGAAGKVEEAAGGGERQRERNQRDKDALRTDVEEMARGQVVVERANEKAFEIVLDWGEITGEQDDRRGYLQSLENVMPKSGLVAMTRLLRRIVATPVDAGNPDPGPDPDESPPTDQENLASLEAAFQQSSVLAHHFLVRAYARLHEHALLVPVAENGLSLVSNLEPLIGKRLSRSRRAFETPLATALVQWEAPKHHLRATRIVDRLLEDDLGRDDAEVLLAKAGIEAGRERWQDAEGWYARVLKVASATAGQRTEAEGEGAWCRARQGRYGEAAEELQNVVDALDATPTNDDRAAARLAQAWYRLGRCHWDGPARDAKAAYAAYIRAIKRHASFAPPFTSLGLYYLEAISPPDFERASKCFQKAFELDAREDVAARKLADEFAEAREWDLVDIVARRLIEGTGGGSAASSLGGPLASRLAWAWLALGSAEMAKKRYPAAVSAFQSAVRGAPGDAHAWIKLGLAYRGAGKHVAALKTFAKAQEMTPELWWASFCVADVQRALGLADPAIKAFEKILDERPDEVGVRIVLAETLQARAVEHLRAGYSARAEACLEEALDAARTVVEGGAGVRIAWKVVGDAFSALGRLRSLEISDGLRSHLAYFVDAVARVGADGKMAAIDAVTALETSAIAAEDDSPGLFVLAAALAFKTRVLFELQGEAGPGSAWYDLGIALSRLKDARLKLVTSAEAANRQAIQCVRSALQHEPANAAFWNGLGVLGFSTSPRLAQHAFIRSVEINERSPVAWSNLGFLYLVHGDRELANQAFLKAQINDPESALAWIGQALLAALNGDVEESSVLVDHAFSLPAVGVPEADLSLARTALQKYATSGRTDATTALAPAFFAVSRVLQRDGLSPSALHLHALLAERIGQLEEASSSFEKCAEILEAQYEDDESPDTEARYVQAFANLGRVRLAMGEHVEASEAFETVLGLRPTAEEGAEVARERVQALIGDGLARFFAEDLEGSLASFQALMQEAPEASLSRRRGALMLARVLWATGGREQREEARRTLLGAFGAEGESDLAAVAALTAIGVIEGDQPLVDATVAEIVGLGRDKRSTLDPEMVVDDLLVAQHLVKGETRDATAILVSAAHAAPSSARARYALASHLLRTGIPDAAASAARQASTAGSLMQTGADARPVARSEATVLEAVAQMRIANEAGFDVAMFLEPGGEQASRALALEARGNADSAG